MLMILIFIKKELVMVIFDGEQPFESFYLKHFNSLQDLQNCTECFKNLSIYSSSIYYQTSQFDTGSFKRILTENDTWLDDTFWKNGGNYMKTPFSLGTLNSNPLSFIVSGSEKLLVTSDGIGINMSPSYSLDINGSLRVYRSSLYVTSIGSVGGIIDYTRFLSVNGSTGINGQFLKRTFSSNDWSNILTSDVTGLNAYTSSVNTSLTSLNSYTSSINSLTGSYFTQGGNSFGTTAILGTNDNNSLILETSGSARMFISSSGFIGIGNTTPETLLHLKSTTSVTSPFIRLESTSTGRPYIDFKSSGSLLGYIGWAANFSDIMYIRNTRNSDIYFGTNETNQMAIKNNGNVTIGGTTDFGYKFSVEGTSRFNGASTYFVSALFRNEAQIAFYANTGTRNVSQRRQTTDEGDRNGIVHFGFDGVSYNIGIVEKDNGTVGINTHSPVYNLDVSGNLRTTMDTYFATTSGNVGIGTTNPTSKIHIKSSGTVISQIESTTNSGTVINRIISLNSTGGILNFEQGVNISTGNSFETYDRQNSQLVDSYTVSGSRSLYTNGINRLNIFNNGNVGIGISSDAGYKLDVNGDINIPQTSNYKIAGNPFLQRNTSFWNYIYDFSNNVALQLGGTSDPVNYSNNTQHIFRSRAGSEYMRIDANGRLGIGLTAPTKKLHVYDNSGGVGNTTIRLESLAGGYGAGIEAGSIIAGTSTYLSMGKAVWDGEAAWNSTTTTQDSYFTLHTAQDGVVGEKMRITSGGNVGIGTTPRNKVEINGTTATLTALSSNTANGTLLLSDGGNLGVVQGISNYNSTYQGYVQVRNNDGANSTAYDYLINPLGGNVGIGTTSPSYKLDVFASSLSSTNGTILPIASFKSFVSSDSQLNIEEKREAIGTDWTTVTTYIRKKIDATNMAYIAFNPLGSTGDAAIAFGTGYGATEKMRIDRLGNVGIGTTAPSYQLDVSKSTGGGWVSSRIVNTSDGAASLILQNGVTGGAKSWTINTSSVTSGDFDITQGVNGSGTSRLYINTSGNVGIGTTTPSQKLSVLVSAGTAIPTIGSAGGHQILSNGSYGMMFGVNTTGNGWIQTARTDATATNYNLLLNPNGGNVGIGTQTPQKQLEVSDIIRSTSNFAGFEAIPSTGASYRWTLNNDSNFFLQSSSDKFVANAATRLVIYDGGNIGIGTSSNGGYKLDVNGSTRATRFEASSTTALTLTHNGFQDFHSSGALGTIRFLDAGYGNVNLQIEQTGNTYIRGNLGVGTSSTYKGHIYGGGEAIVGGITNAGAKGASLLIQDSGGTTGNGGALVLAAGQGVGAAIKYHATDGSNFSKGDLSFQIRINTTDTFLSTALQIKSTGNVGIGTTSPSNLLHIKGTATQGIGVRNSHLIIESAETAGVDVGAVLKFGGQSGNTVNPYSFGTIEGKKESAVANNYSSYLSFFTIESNGGSTERMRINGSGNVGIGTTTPSQKLEVVSAGETSIRLFNTLANSWDIKNNATEGAFQLVRGGSNVHLHIGNGGNVGLGTVAPTNLLHLKSANPVIRLETATNNGYIDYSTTRLNISSGGLFTSFTAGDAERMRIFANGNIAIGKNTDNGNKLQIEGGINISDSNALSFGNATQFIINNPTNSQLAFASNGGINMAITNGKVGIGTQYSNSKLEIVGGGASTTDGAIRLTNSVSNQTFGIINGIVGISNSGFSIRDITNDTDRLVINSTGNVGIGTTSPTEKLTVEGNVSIGSSTAFIANNFLKLYASSGTIGKFAALGCSNGNLHIDAAVGNATYINYFNGSGTIFGNGASAASGASIASGGGVTATSFNLNGAMQTAPASATAAGTTGQIRYTSTHIYVCINTNTWVRTALTTW
jgi:hypothetical protein